MKLWSCFPPLIRKKKQKDKVDDILSRRDTLSKDLKPKKSSSNIGNWVLSRNQKNRRCSVKVMSVESPIAVYTTAEAAKTYVGEDKHEENLCLIKREHSGFDLQRCEADDSNRNGGYTSDPLEPKQAMVSPKIDSAGSYSINKGSNDDDNDCTENSSRDGSKDGNSNSWPQNQSGTFSAEPSSVARVSDWVKDLEDLEIHNSSSPLDDNDIDHEAEDIAYSLSQKNCISRSTSFSRLSNANLSKEISYANSIVQSQSATSTVAHICGAGLKVIPRIVHFSNLRYVNLSSNCITHITPGLLPKGLHSLNLSRNKISTMEGLRELMRLRSLDLSYNRITGIGQALSNCFLIKELYLAGNKISNIEGLHRLLKLRVLDASFNKIATTKSLEQLVANYNSLQALNLSGNPVQSNMSEEQLRKAVCGLFPKLVYLNKQIIKPRWAGEVFQDTVSKAALGNSSWRSHRKAMKKSSQVRYLSSSNGQRNDFTVGQTSLQRSKSLIQLQLCQNSSSASHRKSSSFD